MKTAESIKGTSDKRKGALSGKQDTSFGLKGLFEDSLKDIYWAEKALTKAIPKMARYATSPELTNALLSHLKETDEQVNRLEKVFEIIGQKAVAKKCDAMEGLIKESEGIVEETESGLVRDAGIINACQKIEHYEIATYGTLRQFAETLEIPKAVILLEQTLEEEKGVDKKLTEIAVNSINTKAAEIV